MKDKLKKIGKDIFTLKRDTVAAGKAAVDKVRGSIDKVGTTLITIGEKLKKKG